MMFFSAMDVQTVWNTKSWIEQKYPIVLFLLVLCTQCVLCTGDCGGTFTTTSGSFNSPNFPYNYNNNQNCTYLISLPRDYRITLTFFNFSLVCSDYIKIVDGDSTAAPSFGTYCSQKPDRGLRSTQSEMLVRFHTDGSKISTGFNASYSSGISSSDVVCSVWNDVKSIPDYTCASQEITVNSGWDRKKNKAGVLYLFGDQFIVRSTSTDMRRLDSLTISTTGSVPVELHSLRNLEFDEFDFKIFWTENNDTRIHSVFLNGTSRTVVADLGENAVLSDIAFDAPSALLFYLDSGNDVIGVFTPAGDAHMRVITTDLQDQSAIAVDTQLRIVYWTADNKIKRVNYDGSGDTTFFSQEGLETLLSITVDSQHGYVYFLASDRDTATITSLNSDGTQKVPVYTTLQTIKTATRLIFNSERIYFINILKNSTEWKSEVEFVRRDGRHDHSFHLPTRSYQDVCFFNESAWHQEPTECRRNLSVCSSHQICLPGPSNNVECMPSEETTTNGYTQSTPVYNHTDPTTSQALEPSGAANASAKSVAGVDNTLIILGGSLGGFAFIVTVALIIFVVIFINRKGRSEGKPMAMDEIAVRPQPNVYEPNRQPDDEVATHYDNPVCQGALAEHDYVLPVPALPPRGNTHWSNGDDDNNDYMTLT